MKGKKQYYLCIGCGALHASNECTDCHGCSEKSKCLDDLKSANTILVGKCIECEEKFKVPHAA